ncbi:MAG: tetratricopeptide repeat protein [Bacillota bacterium]
MMKITTFNQLLELAQYEEAISVLLEEYNQVKKGTSLSVFRKWLNDFSDANSLKDYLKVMDTALMGKLSTILIKANYKRIKTPMMTIWYCEELVSEHKLIEAEKRLKELLKHELTQEEEEKLYFVLADTLMNMQRFSEAKTYMDKCEGITREPMNTRWGYYYLQKGDWDHAVEFLGHGKLDKKDGVIAFSLLIQHYAIHGQYDNAQFLIEEGLAQHPNYPKLLVEKVRLFYQMKQWDEMRTTIAVINHLTPYNDYKELFEDYIAESYYYEQNLPELTRLLSEYPHLTKQSLFKEFRGTMNLPVKLLTYKPAIQKYNYCVPASLEMLLSQFNHYINQDIIADSVFSVSGTKLSKAIEYLEEQGYACQFFYGAVESFKSLLDLQVGVMLNVDYPMSSHVQVLVGYDDNLRVLHVQDPNFREYHQIHYADLQKEYGNNQVLALAIVQKTQLEKITSLDKKQHEVVSKMLSLAEVEDNFLSSEDEHFVKENLHELIVAAYTLRYIPKVISQEVLEKAIATVTQHLVNNEYSRLIIAHAYCQTKQLDLALTYVDKDFSKRNKSTYWFLKGRIYYDQNQYPLAIEAFKEALNYEPEDHMIWSYIALSFSYLGDNETALYHSKISLDINEEDTFALVNYGVILYDSNKYDGARDIFHELLKINKHDPYFWYERARCDHQLGRYHFARKGFRIAISLEQDVPFPYRDLASLYELLDENEKRAEKVLLDGLTYTNDSTILLNELGDLYERTQRYEEARTYLLRATDSNPSDVFPWISLGTVLKSEEKFDELFDFMKKLELDFSTNSEFLINGGKLLWDAAIEVNKPSYFEFALDFIEKGIQHTSHHIDDVVEMYVEVIGDTAFYRRGIAFLEEQCASHNLEDSFLYLCYIGCLYEKNGFLHKAKQYLEQALTIKEGDILPFYRLGEIAFKLEDYKEAEDYYQKVLTLDPSHEQSYLDLASIASAQGDQANEKDFLLKAFYLNPYSVKVEDLVGVIDQKADLEVLLEFLNSLMKKHDKGFLLDSIAYVYGKLGDFEKEEAFLNEALLDSPHLPQLLYHQAKLWMKQGKTKQAKGVLLSLIEEHVDDRDLYKLLVELASNTRSVVKLEGDFKKLKLEKAERSLALMFTAAAYEKMMSPMENSYDQLSQSKGFFKKLTSFSKLTAHFGVIIGFYETAIKLDRENVIAVMWLADFYVQAELSSDAIKVLEQALVHNSNVDIAYRLAALYVEDMVNVKPSKQYSYLTKAKELLEFCLAEHEDPEYMNLLAYVLFEREELPEAEAMYLRCLSIEPTIDKGYFNLARLYLQMEKFSEAEKASNAAIELEPDNEDNYNQLGLIFHRQGREEQALEAINKAVELNPDDLFCLYNRACFLVALGNMKEAAKQLEHVFALDDEDYFIELAEDDEDMLPLKEAGCFPV